MSNQSQEKIILKVEKREATGKQVKKLRATGLVPGSVYGAKQEPISIQIELNPLVRAVELAGTHTPVEIDLDGLKLNAIIKTVERDVVKRTPTHVAFQAVAADQIIKTEVPLHIIDEDESIAKKSGLVILQDIERIEVKAKPADLPEALTISAAALEKHGDKLLVADIKVPEGVELLHENPDQAVASVYEPSAIAAKNAAIDEANAKEAATEGETETTEGAAAEGAEPSTEEKPATE
jgi:large subunit ribosomal protein L25